MGLFDRFRKKVREAASEVDSDSLSAEEGSDEALEALSHQEQMALSRRWRNRRTMNKAQLWERSCQVDVAVAEDAILILCGIYR